MENLHNVPPGFWLFALGMLTGWCSMLVPCWIALRFAVPCEISAGGVCVKADTPRRAQGLFLAAFEANHHQRAALAGRNGPFRSGADTLPPPDQVSSGRKPGGGYQPVTRAPRDNMPPATPRPSAPRSQVPPETRATAPAPRFSAPNPKGSDDE